MKETYILLIYCFLALIFFVAANGGDYNTEFAEFVVATFFLPLPGILYYICLC